MRKNSVYLFAFLFAVEFSSVASCKILKFQQVREIFKSPKENKATLKILNWNVETFFDANFDGNEYSQFRGTSSHWTQEKYEKRLKNLVEVIKTVNADVVVIQELEKKEQLNDIFNSFCSSFNSSKNYNYACFAKEDGAAIGLAVLSRLPLKNPTVHSLDIRGGVKKQPALRPLLKIYVEKGGKDILLMINHWKSKSGGEQESKIWREYQETLLAENFLLAQDCGEKALACGDFNQDINEFAKIHCDKNSFNIALGKEKSAKVYSPWFYDKESLVMPGSYFFRNRWERIDHFFAGRGVNILDFKVENKGAWATNEGKPKRYAIKSASGYSDHFPISCKVEW
ncbi:endonuclease/exonuclease/phosphatase family protein [Treponema pectinovorum]|uniref:endonuclease/exonuclease/phosphatase family protein n=1 Tax=Treponema pectinovorum TaxID=164 RepID=UPI0011C7588D|nr:endonuclease/exonuclease/phosphatase family protein [Treponema pectinovorum]